ncbi:TPA: hypothetical protein K8M77_000283 [Clostridium perfringens]|nr:hypothetical protein [Clostridium perfringens]
MAKYLLIYKESLSGEMKLKKFNRMVNLAEYLQTNPEYIIIAIAEEL